MVTWTAFAILAMFLPTFGAQTTYDCQKDQQDETDIQKCSMVLTFNNCVDCLCYKERQIKSCASVFEIFRDGQQRK